MRRAAVLVAVWYVVACAAADEKDKKDEKKPTEVEVRSDVRKPAVPLAESPAGVVVFHLRARIDAKGEGKGILTLDPNQRTYDEFGGEKGSTDKAEVKLDCTLRFVKSTKRRGPGWFVRERFLYKIQGKKIKTPLFLATGSRKLDGARLLIHDKKGKVAYVIGLPPVPPRPPCHPGCFPAGTLVQTPKGPRPIERIGAGDLVTTVRADGRPVSTRVQSVFVTRNRLMKVETERGVLITTATQPLCLAGGQVRAVEELKAGDRIVRWHAGKRQTVKVRKVSRTDREEKVINLVLGNSELFIAGGFLARSKPPARAAASGGQE